MAATQPEENEKPQIVNLSQSNMETVQAGMVRASQSSFHQVNSEEVDLQTSIAVNVSTGDFHAHDSIVGAATSQQATLGDSIAGFVRADTLTFDGEAAFVIADQLSGKNINSMAVIGTNVEAASIQTGLLISREVHGNVTTTLDGRTTLMAGAVAGAVIGLILLAGKLLFGRND